MSFPVRALRYQPPFEQLLWREIAACFMSPEFGHPKTAEQPLVPTTRYMVGNHVHRCRKIVWMRRCALRRSELNRS